ncbi:hypothetical protein [Stieleria varia]|uniref:hypothetical protein n=1 Tax=Stieleria varia TaxID=2528005 RepID=UPI0018D1F73F|nr:hypothetical protein [Stieleria varia]
MVYWIEENNAWDRTAVIVTADHGHYLVLDDPQKVADASRRTRKKQAVDASP